MALGLPVVTTGVGAEGIDETGEVLFLAKTDQEFVDIVERLLTDNDLMQEYVCNGIRYIKERFSWKFSERELEQIYPSYH